MAQQTRAWTTTEQQFLVEHWKPKCVPKVARMLTRSQGSVKAQAQKMGLTATWRA